MRPYRIVSGPLKNLLYVLKEFCCNLIEFYYKFIEFYCFLWRFTTSLKNFVATLWNFITFFEDFTNCVAIFQNFIASFTFVFQSQQLYSTRVFSTSNWGLTSINKCHVQKLKIARFFCTVPQGRGGEPEDESAGQSGQCSLLALEQWSIEISN